MSEQINEISSKYPGKPFIVLINKVDTIGQEARNELTKNTEVSSANKNQQLILLSAKDRTGIDQLSTQLLSWIDQGILQNDQVVVTNSRHYDALTNLPNRALLKDRLDQAIARAQRNTSCVGILFLDLDHFKSVNDNFGHDVGGGRKISEASDCCGHY